MGNCQAVDAAAMVIQRPSGKIERHYAPVSVSQVMRNNPGHYVSLIIPLPTSDNEEEESEEQGVPPEKKKTTVRYTRVKILRVTDTLVLGHAYRLLTTQEVTKVLRAKKHAKMKKSEEGLGERSVHVNSEKPNSGAGDGRLQVAKKEREGATTTTMTGKKNGADVGRSKSWRPLLQSISEASS